jgi:hypothetical protein
MLPKFGYGCLARHPLLSLWMMLFFATDGLVAFFAVSLVDLEIFAGHRFICYLIKSVATYFLWRFDCCGVIPFFDLQH